MGKRTQLIWIGVIVLAIGVALAFSLFHQIEVEAEKTAQWVVPPVVDNESIAEVGYIYDVRREINFRKRKREITWWVKVPSTDKIYTCSWKSGYPEFSKHDGVQIVHKKSGVDTVDYSGFIVGINGRQRGHSARVWALDVEELEEIYDDLNR